MTRALQGAGEGMARANHPVDKVRALQRALYVAAKHRRTRRFHALYDRIARLDVLRAAWRQVRGNRGAAGIDGETLAAIEAYGVERMLEELRELLLTGRYRPQPVRRVYIPKPGRPHERRGLGIPRRKGPGGTNGDQAGHRANLRGQLPAQLIRLPTQAGRAPSSGAHSQGDQRRGAVGGRS